MLSKVLVMPHKLRAVVVDDDEMIGRMLSHLLKQHGYEVFIYAGIEFCPLLSKGGGRCESDQNCADVLICDVQLGATSGFEVIEKLAASGCRCQYVALMTGRWTTADRERADVLGCKAITKPFSINEVAEWLESCKASIDTSEDLADL